MDDFSFPSDYTPPASNGDNFLKFTQNGKYYFRILSSPIIGYEYWSKAPGAEKAKPIRSKTRPDESELIHPEIREGKKSFPKEFYAFKVFAYNDNTRKAGKIKVLSTTTKSIKDDIRYFMTNADFPKADKYDFIVEREGPGGLKTTYNVSRLDSSEQTPELQEANATVKVNLDALFENKDPFDLGADPALRAE